MIQNQLRYVYELMEDDAKTIGIFERLEVAKEAARGLHIRNNRHYQVNKIPLNTLGSYGEVFDDVWSTEDDVALEAKDID